ncbi:hypothetical protein MKO96_13030 [Bacillus sp. ES1-5]|nr:hypothetical protein [Bacillus sp. ES1-5]
MKESVKKDKKTGKYFYIVDIGIDPLTAKRKQKISIKCFNKAALRSLYRNICRN